MTDAPKRWSLAIIERISSQALIRLLIAGVLVLALWACVVLLGIARADDIELLDDTEDRLLLVLQNRGLSGLTVASSAYDDTLLPPRDMIELVIWRKVAGTRILLHETIDGLSDLARDPADTSLRVAQKTYLLRWPDIKTASSNWELSYADVELVIALRAPSAQMQNARRLVASICVMSTLFLIGMILINRNHQRRYARGLDAINETLDLFAQGQTEIRVPDGRVAPEIDRLAGLLNTALSRIDKLTNGLRFMSAHLAHEINTPLQKIRVLAVRIAGEPDAEERVVRVNEIDRILDSARARQQNLMQLFRLEAGEVTTLDDHIDLGDLVESIYEDFEDVLADQMRQVSFAAAKDIEIAGNRPLMELLVTNLLTNARKYAVPKSNINICLTQAGDRFRLIVSNDGSVFPERVRVGSFRRFVRADDGGGPQGAGLGLNLVFAICQAHGFEVALPEALDKAIVEVTGTTTGASGGRR
ncbi:MAG: sensor histidine kinase [Roseobacter sp.]